MDTNASSSRFDRAVKEIAASVEVVLRSNLPAPALHSQNTLGVLYPSIACKMDSAP